ncbi:hypothetical protein [Fangia hongkongensis]|uniref:hypothetical protein n=1 Tax=Fangia hongkongensis TaxID=270495 RepID=UPI0003605D7E|nr:hypothetical protein [Fangia hongkongensis]MBK2124787.1 hypothetical protein [Fangia hongkongensis]
MKLKYTRVLFVLSISAGLAACGGEGSSSSSQHSKAWSPLSPAKKEPLTPLSPSLAPLKPANKVPLTPLSPSLAPLKPAKPVHSDNI